MMVSEDIRMFIWKMCFDSRKTIECADNIRIE